MSDGERVQLRGNTTGFSVETRATTHFEHWPPRMYRGKPIQDDDYLYCIVEAVFAPSMPDPDGYSVKFAGASREEWLGKPSRTPFGKPERPGYGSYQITAQTCASLLDPPDKDC
jgi:hypothetical protein